MSPFAELVAALEARDLHVSHNTGSKAEVQCPAHSDRTASLSIGTGDDGRVLLHCHAGCENKDILAALDLKESDLFEKSSNGRREIVAIYDYEDESGPQYQVVRFSPKGFAQRRADVTGDWQWNLMGARRVLFRLPQVIKAVKANEPIYVVEGEKDVEALERAGQVATCNSGGAGKWRPEYAEVLRGATVTIVADRDDPGRKHAEAVAKSLDGIATTVKIVQPPEPYKDASDLLAAGGSIDALVCDPSGPDPVELVPAGDLLLRVGDLIERYVVLPSEDAKTALVLFVLHTWAIVAAHSTPYMSVVSAEKQSGKTRLLEVLALLVREPWHTASTTEAALFRKIEQAEPTLLLDEIDAIFGSYSERTEPLRAALNAGNRRGASVARVIGQGTQMEVKDFSVFCPKVLAGIDTGRLPETIQDRAVTLHLKRRREGESVERLRYRFAVEEVMPLRADLEAWAAGAVEHLGEAIPDLPDELQDRAADAWEPLFAIADLAGGEWPARARCAAVELSTSTTGDEVGRGAQLLAATRIALAGREVIATAELLEAINTDDELPFGGWSEGKGLDGRGLARLLKPYGIRSRTVRVGEHTPKGYRRADIQEAWERYLPPSEGQQGKQGQQVDEANRENPSRHIGDVAHVAHVAHVARVDGVEGDVAHTSGNETLADRAMREYGVQA